jgi:predicted FMN-binding regulatory protein PaiB
MAWNYVKISMFGTAAAYSRDDEIMAVVAVLTQTPQKHPWRGSVPG